MVLSKIMQLVAELWLSQVILGQFLHFLAPASSEK